MIQQKYDEQVSQAKALQGELSKRQLELQSKDKRISTLEQKLVQNAEEVAQKTGGYNAQVLLNDEQAARLKELEEEQTKYSDEREKFVARVEFLESELALRDELQTVQVEEFEQLRKSNEQLAGSLAAITGKLGQVSKTSEKLRAISAKRAVADKP